MKTHATRGTRPLRTALFDPFVFAGASSEAYEMAHKAGASYIRLIVHWSSIAPDKRPAGFAASKPASPGYAWTGVDRMVSAVEAAGLEPIVDVAKPPAWAYAVRPHKTFAGTPKVKPLRHFATALARHFDGTHGVPRVRIFQVWNEPNNSMDLSPVRPAVYRAMVNAFSAGVHSVDRRDLVVAGGLDPFGHKKRKRARFYTVKPLAFMRSVLCLSRGKHPHRTCKAKAHFDVWAHNPYTYKGPFGRARIAGDVSLGDLPTMRKLLQAGVHLHKALSSRSIQFWVTEFGWDTKPPRPHGAPVRLQARWTSAALYQMWRSGVTLATSVLLEDRPNPSPYQSGLYFYAPTLAKARAKPTRQAFRFPFVAFRGKHDTVRVWGRDATSDKKLVTIQRRYKHGRWHTVARIRSNRFGIFKATLRLKTRSRDWLRAEAHGSGKSLAFSLKVPKHRRYGPFGK